MAVPAPATAGLRLSTPLPPLHRDHVAMLATHASLWKALDIAVVVLSLCPTPAAAAEWDEQVGHPFPHLQWAEATAPADAYAAFGFKRSLAGVWGAQSLGWYAQQAAAGRELQSSRGQDVHQLAGDVVVSAEGTVVLPYYGLDNTDRPGVTTLAWAAAVAACNSQHESPAWSAAAQTVRQHLARSAASHGAPSGSAVSDSGGGASKKPEAANAPEDCAA